MPEAALDDGQIHSGLQQSGGVAMTQRMDAARLAYAGLVLGGLVDVRGTVAAQGSVGGATREQPGPGPYPAPVGAQVLQQLRRERHVPVVVALPLVDAQRHAPGIDVADAQTGEFAGPQSGGVGGHEQGPMLGVAGDGEQPHQLVVVEDFGQLGRLLGTGHVQVGIGQPHGDAIEEAHAVANGVATPPRQAALLVQEEKVVLDLPGLDMVRAAPIVTGKSGHGAEVGRLGVLRQPANGHVVDHALAKSGRCVSP